jgi:hypothetical protein
VTAVGGNPAAVVLLRTEFRSSKTCRSFWGDAYGSASRDSRPGDALRVEFRFHNRVTEYGFQFLRFRSVLGMKENHENSVKRNG